MKALVYYGKKDVRCEVIPEPSEVRPQEVLLHVKYAGLCHTDLNEYLHGPFLIPKTPHIRTGRSIPLVIGHEFSGLVVEVGTEVRRVRVGDRVAVNAVDSCGHCAFCRRRIPALCSSVAYVGFARHGGFAEFVVLPEECCYRLAPEMSFQAGALVEPLAVGLHAVEQANVRIGSRAAVVGGGTVGLCALQALRATGIRDVIVIDMASGKEPVARRLGAGAFLHPSEPDLIQAVHERTEGLGVDVAFECVGSPSALKTAMDITASEGTICVLGIFSSPFEFDLNLILKQEKRIITSLGYGDEFPTVIAMLADGRLVAEPMITRIISLGEGVRLGLDKYDDGAATNIRTLIGMEASSSPTT